MNSLDGKDLDKLIADVFKTSAGKKLLSYLEERFVKLPVCVPGQKEGEGYYREGQNSIIRLFINAIQRRQEGK